MSVTYVRVESVNGIVVLSVVDEESYYDLILDFTPDYSKVYYMVYVDYTTGDSYSTESGNMAYVGVYKGFESAKKIAEAIMEDKDEEQRSILEVDLEDEWRVEKIHTSQWKGYFEHVDSVVVAPVTFGKIYSKSYL